MTKLRFMSRGSDCPLDRTPVGSKPAVLIDPTEAQWEWVCRWVFAVTGIRPKLDRISNRDLALLYRAITTQVDRAKLTTSAQFYRD